VREHEVAMLELRQDKGDVLLSVRVAPRSSRDAILGVHAGALKVSLTAPPVDGKANAALTTLLSKTLRVARTTITIERGDHARDKTVRIAGIRVDEVQGLLVTEPLARKVNG